VQQQVPAQQPRGARVPAQQPRGARVLAALAWLRQERAWPEQVLLAWPVPREARPALVPAPELSAWPMQRRPLQ